MGAEKDGKIKKYGFFFGAGAEVCYGLPSGGRFALEIFRRDTSKSKEEFKKNCDDVVRLQSFNMENWLPKGFDKKNITTFGKAAYQTIIKDIIEQNRDAIILLFNEFDVIAGKLASSFMKNKGKDINQIIEKKLGKRIENTTLSQSFGYIDEFKKGNKIFESHYFISLLLLYQKGVFADGIDKKEMRRILLSFLQLQVAALGEDLAKNLNDNLFKGKRPDIDFLNDLESVIQLDYNSTGHSGIEYLFNSKKGEPKTDEDYILVFARELLEEIYMSVMSYQTLIDSYWHYLYTPKADWAKFSKICVFLYTVRDYISDVSLNVNKSNPNGYYNWVRSAVDNGSFKITKVATSNYNNFISEILGEEVTYLNGSTDMWYDPYLNKVCRKDELETSDRHILVPLIFTQSGIKPMTSVKMASEYVEVYDRWKKSDALVVVGYSFREDDGHINTLIRTFVNESGKKLVVVSLDDKEKTENEMIEDVHAKLRLGSSSNILLIRVDEAGKVIGKNKNWVDYLAEDLKDILS